ncbi:MAG: M23 family peptidase, partial [Roseicyclus sp.]|nr:M23 family peptidase [Roseicyclus sp.]
MEKHLPEQRLFLKADEGTRFVRLRPGTQALMIAGGALFVGWTVIVTSIFLIDTISAGGARDQAAREQLTYQTRLNALSDERDARAAEARLAQDRFAVAMDQVSDMQSRLLESEQRRREMETAVDVIQTTLRRTMSERDEARARADQLVAELQAETGTIQTAAGRQQDMEQTMTFLAEALEDTASERDNAHQNMAEAHSEVERLQFEAELAAENPLARDDAETRRLIRALAVAGFGMMNIMLLSVSVWSGAGGTTREMFHWLSALIAIPV